VTEKLQKIIARTGMGSRREIETWIEAGRVSVNGETASLGDRATISDVIRVNGKKIDAVFDTGSIRVLRYHKPLGVVCTRRDPEGRKTVFESLPSTRTGRWIAVGRLDINTSGLLLFTDSGDLANRLMHPSSQAAREYAVRIYGSLTPEVLKSLTEGVELDDGPARFDAITDAGGEGRNHWYHVSLSEGRNRIVRRIWESQGIEVSRLTRIGYAGVELPRRLRAGRWEFLEADDLKALHTTAGLYTGNKAGEANKIASESNDSPQTSKKASDSDDSPQTSARRKPAQKKDSHKKSTWPGKTPTKRGR
jgi:23S rRNA pseudouridine2605 synthase